MTDYRTGSEIKKEFDKKRTKKLMNFVVGLGAILILSYFIGHTLAYFIK